MFVLLSEPRAHRLLLQNNCLVRSSADLMTELYKMMTIHFCCCLFYTSWNITIICKYTNSHFVVADVHTSHFILILLSSFRNSGSETSITTESWVWLNLSSALLRGHLNMFVWKNLFSSSTKVEFLHEWNTVKEILLRQNLRTSPYIFILRHLEKCKNLYLWMKDSGSVHFLSPIYYLSFCTHACYQSITRILVYENSREKKPNFIWSWEILFYRVFFSLVKYIGRST